MYPVNSFLHCCCWRGKRVVQATMTFYLPLNYQPRPSPHCSSSSNKNASKFLVPDSSGSFWKTIKCSGRARIWPRSVTAMGKDGRALEGAPSSPCQVRLLHRGEKAGPTLEGARLCQATLCNLLLPLVATGRVEASMEEGRYIIRSPVHVVLQRPLEIVQCEPRF